MPLQRLAVLAGLFLFVSRLGAFETSAAIRKVDPETDSQDKPSARNS